ncbi:MAG TPA: hypothetical protein VFW92_10945 [Candidatus Limnocylindrales bacterium]|nr:hypothetical protein [Candidatus Limnocylindrales bacterium]
MTIESEASGPGPDAASAQPPHERQEARGATAAQLRRFIKSRPYVPLHELRRRFELNGQFDDVHVLHTLDGAAYIGLPPRECSLIEELVRSGDVGLELCEDPHTPIVVGVYPMHPATRN